MQRSAVLSWMRVVLFRRRPCAVALRVNERVVWIRAVGPSLQHNADQQKLQHIKMQARPTAHAHTRPAALSVAHGGLSLVQAIDELARIFTAAPPSAIAAALDKAGGNVQQAADLLAKARQGNAQQL